MAQIILSTLNARYHHSSFGLRYLYANLGPLQEKTLLKEFVLKKKVTEIVEELLAEQPKLIGFGVYIWNVEQTTAVIRELKARAPEILVVVGGPEVSFETETQALYPLVDFVFCGESDFLFRDFCLNWLSQGLLPKQKIIRGLLPNLNELCWPYPYYNEEDIRNRVIYVEASRGCPFKCEYCLSSLDERVRDFDTDKFLQEMKKLLDRGVRQFKFVDRTFNLSPTKSRKILEFFLENTSLEIFLHFEMVPDRLPEELRDLIVRFPKGSLQFEIGIQTWNPQVAHRVSRRQNYEKIRENLNFLKEKTTVHTHVDLIAGLPGEDFSSFSLGFDAVAQLGADEIQVGILKRLKGTPIVRHDQEFVVKWNTVSPFAILENRDLNAENLQQLSFFADVWDMFANSGRFLNFTAIMREQAGKNTGLFQEYFSFSRFFYDRFRRHHSIPLEDQARCAMDFLVEKLAYAPEVARDFLRQDFLRTGAQVIPSFLGSGNFATKDGKKSTGTKMPKRQKRHQS